MFKYEDISLRALEPEDLDLLYDWENRGEHWAISQTQQPFSKALLKAYLNQQHRDVRETGQLRLMICKAGEAIGTVELFDADFWNQRAGIGVILFQQEFRGQGIARIALDLLMNYAYAHLNFHQLYCNIDVNNSDSISLFKRLGFQQVGVKKDWVKINRKFVDIALFQHFAQP